MREVDFRPDWYVRSLAERAGARLHVSGFVLVAALLVIWWMDATARSRAATTVIAQLQEAHAAQDGAIARLDALDGELVRQKRDLALLTEVRGGLLTAGMLAELSHLAPPSLSLRSLVLDRAPRIAQVAGDAVKGRVDLPKRTVLEVTGWAASGEEIANLVRGMAECPLFTEVTLGYERSEIVEARPVVAFKVICHLPEFE